LKSILRILAFFLIALSALAVQTPIPRAESGKIVLLLRFTGSIDYGVDELVGEAVQEAEKLNAPLVITVDTPGGLLSVAEAVVKHIRDSSVPVIGFVYPRGSAAWSAGTIVLMACHVAAMAPGTFIGAAQPAIYDPVTGSYRLVNESKILNPIVALITKLAGDRNRNITAAEKFVRENLVLDESKALEYHVIEVVAASVEELLDRVDGLVVKLDNGREYKLETRSAVIVEFEGSLRARLIRLLSNPVLSSLTATIGVLLLIFSLLSGHFLLIPLAIGLILLSLVGSGLSANTISLLLLLIGAIALAVELFTPGFGVLGFSGVILIALAISLMPILNPGYLVTPAYQATLFWTGVSIGLALGCFTGFVVYKVFKVRRQPPRIKTTLVGATGKALDDIPRGGSGFVLIEGEYWRAEALEDIRAGDKVVVVGKEGPVLLVKKTESNQPY